jgi:hypothetical protein
MPVVYRAIATKILRITPKSIDFFGALAYNMNGYTPFAHRDTLKYKEGVTDADQRFTQRVYAH